MRRLFVTICLSILVMGGAAESRAQSSAPDRQEVMKHLEPKLRAARHMAFHPVIVRAVRVQNDEGITMDTIQQRDTEWRAAQSETSLQRSISQSQASQVLKTFVERNPDFNEAFATDNQGANVAMFPTTSDYWQGDEDKWSQSFNGGDGRMFVGDVELDDSTGTYAVQVSIPIRDQGNTIGVLVIGVTQSYLQE